MAIAAYRRRSPEQADFWHPTRAQREPAQICLVPVSQAPVSEGAAPRSRREDLRAVAGGQLPGAGQEVSVRVRVS